MALFIGFTLTEPASLVVKLIFLMMMIPVSLTAALFVRWVEALHIRGLELMWDLLWGWWRAPWGDDDGE